LTYYLAKVAISAVLIVLIAEIAKRSSMLGAIIASVPLLSVIAMIWLYVDTRNTEKVAALASSIFWLVIPSLVLFVAFPVLLRHGMSFYLSLALSIALTVLAYFAIIALLRQFGVSL